MLWLEFRAVPAVALLLAVASIALAVRRREVAAARVLAASLGVLSYSYFEVVLYRVTGDALLGSLAHEVVELWFLVFLAELLRRCFPGRAATA